MSESHRSAFETDRAGMTDDDQPTDAAGRAGKRPGAPRSSHAIGDEQLAAFDGHPEAIAIEDNDAIAGRDGID